MKTKLSTNTVNLPILQISERSLNSTPEHLGLKELFMNPLNEEVPEVIFFQIYPSHD